MDIGVEISLYPLEADVVPAVHEFLERLNARPGLKVVTNSLSTQVFGTHEEVFDVLKAEFGRTFHDRDLESGKAVFIMKVVGPLADAA